MPTKKNVISLVVDDDMLRMIDEYRRSQETIPSRSESIRRFVEEGLKALDPSRPARRAKKE